MSNEVAPLNHLKMSRTWFLKFAALNSRQQISYLFFFACFACADTCVFAYTCTYGEGERERGRDGGREGGRERESEGERELEIQSKPRAKDRGGGGRGIPGMRERQIKRERARAREREPRDKRKSAHSSLRLASRSSVD